MPPVILTVPLLMRATLVAVAVLVPAATASVPPLLKWSGFTQLAGGSLIAAQPADIAGGTLSGFGTITGSVQNAGTVSPSTTGGVLKISGAYQQTKAGVLTSVITGTSPGTKFGQLSVGGQATLAGTLKVNPGNGFNPHGKSFSVLLYHSRSGKFTTLSGNPAYTVSYGASAAKVVYP